MSPKNLMKHPPKGILERLGYGLSYAESKHILRATSDGGSFFRCGLTSSQSNPKPSQGHSSQLAKCCRSGSTLAMI